MHAANKMNHIGSITSVLPLPEPKAPGRFESDSEEHKIEMDIQEINRINSFQTIH